MIVFIFININSLFSDIRSKLDLSSEPMDFYGTVQKTYFSAQLQFITDMGVYSYSAYEKFEENNFFTELKTS